MTKNLNPHKNMNAFLNDPTSTKGKNDPIDEETLSVLLLKHGYQLQNKIGSGGFATCYTVRSQKYNKIYVAKTSKINRDASRMLCTNNEATLLPVSVVAEIESLIHIVHTNVIQIFDYFIEQDSYFFIILEYCTGGSIQDFVKNHGPLPLPQLIEYSKTILSTLKDIHALNIAHKDIKPANILIDAFGRPKLADFGLAQHLGSSNLDFRVGGSYQFLSPEYFKALSAYKSTKNRAELCKVDPFISDIWALGITFYFMATGQLPFIAESKTELQKMILNGLIIYPVHIHPRYKELLTAMLTTYPEKRPTIDKLLKLKIFATNPNDRTVSTNFRYCQLHTASSLHLGLRMTAGPQHAKIQNSSSTPLVPNSEFASLAKSSSLFALNLPSFHTFAKRRTSIPLKKSVFNSG